MPIMFHMPKQSIDTWMFDKRRVRVETRLCLRPRRCYISDKHIWLKRCKVVISLITGPGEPLIESYWCDPREFLIWELRRDV